MEASLTFKTYCIMIEPLATIIVARQEQILLLIQINLHKRSRLCFINSLPVMNIIGEFIKLAFLRIEFPN